MTADELKQFLSYDAETGAFTYLVNRGRLRKAGDVAGTVSPKSLANGGGYRVICIRSGSARKDYAAHRLAWLYTHGWLPAGEIDHINGIRDDNRIANLRVCTRAQNMANRGLSASNTSGFKGVSLFKRTGRFRATVRTKHLGYFDTASEAHAAYCRVAKMAFGEFARAA